MAAVPTPTPGEMDMSYAAPPQDLMAPESPAPPVETPPTPTPEPPMAALPEPPPATPEPAPTMVPTPQPVGATRGYIVQRGDSLWDISGRPLILGDRWRWPLLFKANRNSIVDPDLINPGQELTWKASYSMPEIEEAIQKSKDTPKFVPHYGVRKQLPIVY